MATFYSFITDAQADLIRNASLFFVATADPTLTDGPDGVGPINVSPKGGVPLHILSPNRVAYLDYVGSGNETARHVNQGSPITIMVCSFDAENAAIVRLYGKATVTPVAQSPLAELLLQQPAQDLKSRPRQVVEVAVEKTMTSCGYGVPVMTPVRERQTTDRGRRYKAG
ncbi:MAG: pyridoxamine 5'-phosphate oxidase family protein [Caldilineaceae bacterium]